LRAHREHPDDAAIALLHGFHLANARGPMAAWEHLRRFEGRQPIPEERLAEIRRFGRTSPRVPGLRDRRTAAGAGLRLAAPLCVAPGRAGRCAARRGAGRKPWVRSTRPSTDPGTGPRCGRARHSACSA
jgi:hypothetical protein